MVTSLNQNRQFYLATALGESTHSPNLTTAGQIAVYHVGDGNEKAMYFLSKNLKTGEVIKSDYIPVKNIDYVKPVKASAMATAMRKISVSLDTSINSGAPVAGQDYVLRIEFRQFYGMSDEDIYCKDAAVHATSGMAASDFYKAMVTALNRAFSREVNATKTTNPYLSFKIGYSTNSESAEGDGNWAGATATKIIIEELPQNWVLGTEAQERVYFDVFPTTIYTSGDDVIWAKQEATGKYYKEETSSTTVGNGKKIADLEWFLMGERGDQYRQIGWPNDIPTQYCVDPSLQYNLIDIHYAFTDTGVNSYRSEKEITIAVPLSDISGGGGATIYDDINDIIDEIEYHSGLTIAGLSD